MRLVAWGAVCIGLLLGLTACDPTIERRYFTEGAGVDLYTADREKQVGLQREYISFVCEQADISCPPRNWTIFVEAGMNDIDLRCDGFLTWLDARRRDREPVLAEINAISTATHAIMTVTGASPQSLDIVMAAFGLASATYNNWNSRLLISVNQSTVQTVVYAAQTDFRRKISGYLVPDQPTAIYLLRSYLRLCMPTTIEAEINSTPVLVERGVDVKARPLVNPVRPTVIRSVNAPLQPFSPSEPVGRNALGPYEATMSNKDMQRALTILGCPGPDFGPANSAKRKALSKFLIANGKPASDRLTDEVFINLREIGKKGDCST